MTKYVIDLPKGVKFIVGKGYVMWSEKELLRIPVESLLPVESMQEYIAPTVAKDVPVEKRVIELPADVIAELKNIKEDNGDDNLQGFMNDVNDDDELWQVVEGFNRSGMTTDALLGEWWLEHVEFVPKKGPKFYIRAHTLGIPLIGIADTNCDPEELDYVIPGNDDAIRAVKLIVSKMADAVIEAKQGTVETDEEVFEEAEGTEE